MTLIAITNPSDPSAEASIVRNVDYDAGCPEGILENFGDKLEDGAQVVMVKRERVWQYLATRESPPPGGFDSGSIALRNNNALVRDSRYDNDAFIDYMNGSDNFDIIAMGNYPLASDVAAEATDEPLETFTVFGNNDDGEDFVVVVSATEDTVREVGAKAGLVDEDYVDLVDINLIVKGEHPDLECVNV